MSSTKPRVQAVPGVSNPNLLQVQAVSVVKPNPNLEILRVIPAFNPEILPVLSTSGAYTENDLLQLPPGPSLDVIATQSA